MRYFILTLLLSFSFSECTDLNALQCGTNTDCEWVEDIESGNCSNFNNSNQCNNYSQYGCYWYDHWYYSGWDSCSGGSWYIDNSYCQENPNPPTCSEMSQIQCNNNGDCQWTEDIVIGNCSDITNSSECYQTNQCSWYNAGNYGYWYDNCYGGTYEIDNSYCEEYDFIQGDLNGDLILNILDALLIIDIILNQESSDLADINGDGIVNVLDVIELVDIIINR